MAEKKISAEESIAGVLAKVKAVGKDSKNQQQHFNYRGVDAVVNAVHPVLAEVGGFVVPNVLNREVEHATTAKGGRMTVVRLSVRYHWHGTDGGDPVTGTVEAEAFDTADKATAKAMSVAYRTFLLQTLMLPTDDPDPDSEYIERGAPVQSQPKPPAEWRKKIAEAQTEAALNDLYDVANQQGWATDEVIKALTARKNEINANT